MEIERSRIDGLMRGAVAGVAGLLAMRIVTEVAGALNGGSGAGEEKTEDGLGGHDALDDVAVGDIESREGEPATATVGRLAFHGLTGREPDGATQERLGQAIHWSYGILLGAAYGALRHDADPPDLAGGLGYGAAAWVLGDEVMVPLLGLAEGPTAHSLTDHATALGAHLAFGAATAGAAQALREVM